MKSMIKLIRKMKAILLRFRFHRIFGPITGFSQTLSYMVKLSKWIHQTPMPEFNDFYTKHHDYSRRYDLYSHVIKNENLTEIIFFEFGVSQGHSFRWWVEHIRHPDSQFIGFDTFTGLPENWGYYKKGDMSSQGKTPDIDDSRCRFIPGIFQNTLPEFLKTFDSPLRKVNSFWRDGIFPRNYGVAVNISLLYNFLGNSSQKVSLTKSF